MDVPTDILIHLADFYNTGTDYLLGRTDDPAPYPESKCVGRGGGSLREPLCGRGQSPRPHRKKAEPFAAPPRCFHINKQLRKYSDTTPG